VLPVRRDAAPPLWCLAVVEGDSITTAKGLSVKVRATPGSISVSMNSAISSLVPAPPTLTKEALINSVLL
jgi:hypothetical protein